MIRTEKKTYYGLKEACTVTGLSTYFLRKGCRAGTIPHIMNGNRYFVDVPELLESLRKENIQSRRAEA